MLVHGEDVPEEDEEAFVFRSLRNYQNHVTIGQKIAFWSLVPAIVVVPIWLIMGRELFGDGRVGWNAINILAVIDPFVVVMHIAILVLALVRNRQRDDVEVLKDYFVTQRMAVTLWCYYMNHVLLQVFMDDSVFVDHWTIRSAAQILTGIFSLTAAGLLVALLVLASLEPTTTAVAE